MHIETIYRVRYLFPIDKGCRSCLLRLASHLPYSKRVQEFKNEDDAVEFLACVETHFKKTLPKCTSVMNKKYFRVSKHRRIAKDQKMQKTEQNKFRLFILFSVTVVVSNIISAKILWTPFHIFGMPMQ